MRKKHLYFKLRPTGERKDEEVVDQLGKQKVWGVY